MFRAPLNSFWGKSIPPYVNQLLSEESLKKSADFDIESVRKWRQAATDGRIPFYRRSSVELGLAGIVATQLWHHTFIDSSLADLPSWSVPKPEPAHQAVVTL